ncbi:hypothetical protein [Spiroplasma turonicum]|uniref:Lipoprotein n=1 Tax=Spiroplasma turonicum TaxID=216946 RepID=A0A0K1P5L5_9MOLU|nr:hypothetical protein [Spiroplasma turonicum]AKU79616.1 hypothetical protein STURON_00370 [Spiroplasma turonicum]ALX70638.1 hypothetical protein STURO_v1c03700 [Spiroplasma turonicum]
MKKVLKLFTLAILMVSTGTSVACSNNSYEDNIERPEPILPISKTGFNDIEIDDIEVSKYAYTYDLLDVINNKLLKANYDLDRIQYDIYKNDIEINLNDDLYRNGNYKFILTNKDNQNDTITAIIKITNSLYLQDNFQVTDIGEVYDHRPRSILMSLLFYNISMIKYIQKVGDELTKVSNYTYNDSLDGVTIQINDKKPESKPKNFYGKLNLTYKINPFDENNGYTNIKFPATIEKVIQNGDETKKVITDLGNLSDSNVYTVIMYLISTNSIAYNYWSLLLNDFDIDNFKVEPKGNNSYVLRLFTKKYNEDEKLPEKPSEQNGEYNNSSHYIKDTDGIEIKFTSL